MMLGKLLVNVRKEKVVEDKKRIEEFNEFVLCWLATASKTGHPNVAPKEIFLSNKEGELLIAHIASPVSVKNIKENPNVCVSGIDVFTQKGLKCTGRATLFFPKDKHFKTYLSLLSPITKGKFQIHAVIQIKPEKITEILAPSYLFYPNTSEEDQILAAKKQYFNTL